MIETDYIYTLQAHILRFVCRVETPIRLHAHKGSALRGAWAEALMSRTCPQPWVCRDRGCILPHGCAIAVLVGPANEGSVRGRDVPRPYVIEPPLDSHTEYAPGDTLEWRMVLFGRAVEWFPYVVVAVKTMGERGIGVGAGGQPEPPARAKMPTDPTVGTRANMDRDRSGYRGDRGGDIGRGQMMNRGRGQFSLREIWEVNPLSGLQQRLYTGEHNRVLAPAAPLTHEQVVQAAKALPADRITLHFRTPLRLGQDVYETGGERRLVHEAPPFHTLVHRLDGRLRDLTTFYGHHLIPVEHAGGNEGREGRWPALNMDLARAVSVQGHMEWLDLHRYSSRKERRLPMGGLVGRATYTGDLGPFLPLLVWGQFTHVGKYAVMGNGWYEIDISADTGTAST